MNTNTHDGGPAFPRAAFATSNLPNDHDHGPQGGMSLRDWFAGQALAAIATDHGPTCDGYREAVSQRAYALADAMLVARKAAP